MTEGSPPKRKEKTVRNNLAALGRKAEHSEQKYRHNLCLMMETKNIALIYVFLNVYRGNIDN